MQAEGSHEIRDEAEISRDFHNWLLSFLTIFPQYQSTDLYLVGESYSGLYIPWIAEHIIKYQKQTPNTFQINLKGIACGNGVIDFWLQIKSYATYAYYHGLIPLGVKESADNLWTLCIQKTLGDIKHPHGYLADCGLFDFVLAAAGQPNQYNTATFNPYTNIIGNTSVFNTFMNDPEIQEAIHVRGYNVPGINFKISPHPNDDGDPMPFYYADDRGRNPHSHSDDDIAQDDDSDDFFYGPADDDGGIKTQDDYQKITNKKRKLYGISEDGYFEPARWSVCHEKITDVLFQYDHPKTSVPALQFVSKYIKVMLYSGELDLNCNIVGTLAVLEANHWLGTNFNTATRGLWRNNGDVAGEYYKLTPDVENIHGYTGLGSFSFMVVRNAGHLVPYDQPANALNMLDRFINDLSFIDTPLPSDISYSSDSTANDDTLESFDQSSSDYSYDHHYIIIPLLMIMIGFFGFYFYGNRKRGVRSVGYEVI